MADFSVAAPRARPLSVVQLAIVFVLIVASCAAYWYNRASYLRAREAARQLIPGAVWPPILNGFEPVFDGVTSIERLLERPPSVSLLQGTRSAVIVLSDDCQWCERSYEQWRVLFTQKMNGQVVLVTFAGRNMIERLGAVLERAGTRRHLYEVDRLDRFLFGTGITSTPTTLLVDERGRVQFVSVGAAFDVSDNVRRFLNAEVLDISKLSPPPAP